LADDILSRSAAEVVALYRSKQVSPVEVVTATLDRIERLDRSTVLSSWSIASLCERNMHQKAG
jgi:Asp-tRNA(Asn)/Glu-tRNA(Gln) amidotransferase A subunit family amidase